MFTPREGLGKFSLETNSINLARNHVIVFSFFCLYKFLKSKAKNRQTRIYTWNSLSLQSSTSGGYACISRCSRYSQKSSLGTDFILQSQLVCLPILFFRFAFKQFLLDSEDKILHQMIMLFHQASFSVD